MKKRCMLYVALCVSLLVGCGSEEKSTEMVMSTENKDVTEEITEASTEEENTEMEHANAEDTVTTEVVENTQETQEDIAKEAQDNGQDEVLVTDQEETELNEDATEGETDEGYYMVATSKSAKEVEEFAANVRSAVVNKDWNTLATYVSDSVRMDGSTVEGSSAFLKLDIDSHLNQAFVDAIEAESGKAMFCNYQGIMMGQGEIWIGDVQNDVGSFELKIIAINGLLVQ